MAIEASPYHLSFTGPVTIQNAEEVLARLRPALAENSHLVIDCSNAEKVDACGIQLFLAARRTAIQNGKTVQVLAGPSLWESLELGGFTNPTNETLIDPPIWIDNRR